ncbi:hypothetical protein [Lysinibacillus xylanilyticus]|uniref:hypothetical protein n=1 Tax=Lysinibacillus xylanilyticus TaxID=582475 RepID=UPI003CFF7287
MISKIDKKTNRIVVREYVFKKFLFILLEITFLYFLFKTFFPNIFKFSDKNFKIVLVGILIFIIYRSYKDFSKKVDYLDTTDLIYEISKKEDGKERLYRFMMLYSETIDKSKLKIDILKSFTPIPIIVFFLGVLWNSDISILGVSFTFLDNIKNFSASSAQILVLIMFITFFYYLYSFSSAWSTYKSAIKYYYEFKYEYDTFQKEK